MKDIIALTRLSDSTDTILSFTFGDDGSVRRIDVYDECSSKILTVWIGEKGSEFITFIDGITSRNKPYAESISYNLMTVLSAIFETYYKGGKNEKDKN